MTVLDRIRLTGRLLKNDGPARADSFGATLLQNGWFAAIDAVAIGLSGIAPPTHSGRRCSLHGENIVRVQVLLELRPEVQFVEIAGIVHAELVGDYEDGRRFVLNCIPKLSAQSCLYWTGIRSEKVTIIEEARALHDLPLVERIDTSCGGI